MFVQTLDGDARAWYKSQPVVSIDEWESFNDNFTEKWGYKQDSSFLLAEFTCINKKENETISKLNTWFCKIYSKIPQNVRLMLKLT